MPGRTLTSLIQATKHTDFPNKEKGQPRLRLAFLTDAYLLAEQRFDIQPLRLQDFAQTAQAFNLNLANTFTGEANFTTYIFQCCRFVPQQTESTCQHFTLFGVQLEPAI